MTRPPTSLTQLAERMGADEGHHLELEEAKSRYDFEELVRYCVALANEGGGRMVHGVTWRPLRRSRLAIGGSRLGHVSRRPVLHLSNATRRNEMARPRKEQYRDRHVTPGPPSLLPPSSEPVVPALAQRADPRS